MLFSLQQDTCSSVVLCPYKCKIIKAAAVGCLTGIKLYCHLSGDEVPTFHALLSMTQLTTTVAFWFLSFFFAVALLRQE